MVYLAFLHSAESLPQPGQPVPQLGQNLSQRGQPVPQPGQAAPQPGLAVPQPGQAVIQAGQAVALLGHHASQLEQDNSLPGQNIPQLEQQRVDQMKYDRDYNGLVAAVGLFR